MDGLCTVLSRPSYPWRYSEMIPRYGKPVPLLSMVTNAALVYVFTTHSYKILLWNQTILQRAQLQIYADVVSLKGAVLNNCFGFIDRTVWPICRPGEHQGVVYNGRKHVHTQKLQSVALLNFNRLITNVYGPVGWWKQRKHHSKICSLVSNLKKNEHNSPVFYLTIKTFSSYMLQLILFLLFQKPDDMIKAC